MAKLQIWLFLLALSASRIHGETSSTYRFRRQHSSQQNLQLNSPLYNTYIYDEIHIKQQGDLARIQHFLVRNNVTLGVSSQFFEKGNWGEWSVPTECSRRCGGGVVAQTRICLEGECLGPSKKFYSCNTEDCDPDEPDFREKQCSDFDAQSFKGRYFSWIPYTQAQNPCELNCMPKGERFYYRHLEKVVDGTKCFSDGSLDVCVDGQCMPVGCDNQLGSNKKADKCGVCGGDGTSCHTIQGVLENDNLRTGYNDLFTIPAGARNIKIEEIAGTSNYLAIRSIKGNYYLNGNWKIEFPRSLKFAGTVFNYVRESNAHDSAESLSSSGPINEPLVVVILYQERNRGIRYEYSIKKNDSSLQTSYDQIVTGNEIDRMDRYPERYPDRYSDRHPERHPDRYYGAQYQNYRTQIVYRWWSGDFTPCSRHCSGGQQQRRVVCLKLQAAQAANMSAQELPAGTEIVQDQYCDSRRKPAPIQNCNTHVCPPIWQVGHWSNCICDSKVNETRIKIRSVSCKKGSIHPDTGRPIPDVWMVANDDECDEVRGTARRPSSIRLCDDENEECVNATLALTANATTANATSEGKNETEPLSDKKILELDDLLNELATAPALRKCQITYAYKWNVGNWAKCDSRCGEGRQRREVTCVEIDPTTGRLVNENRALPDLYCRHEAKPKSERKCDDVPCDGVDWVVSEWSRCVTQDAEASSSGDSTTDASVDVKPSQSGHLKNQTKLSSIQTRSAVCSTRFGRIYEDSLCGLSKKPETKRKCEKKQAVAQWFTSEWSSCSAVECGTGFRTRTVLCAVGDGSSESIRVVDEKDCNENVKPICEESCSGKQEVCDELVLVAQSWSSCVDKCEQTRTLICLARNQTTNSLAPVSCEDKTGGFEVRRKCESESVDAAQTECNPNELDKNCTSTEFGCCPFSDGEAAEGPNFKGCQPKLNEECEKSEFGCCHHSQSEAFGPFQLGCILNCNFTLFGCCIDNVTIAINAELENCLPLCYSTEFGCCKDNSTAIDTEKSNCPENAKKPVEKSAVDDEICEEEIVEGSGDELVEGSGSSNSSDQIDLKPAKVCKKKTAAAAAATADCKNTKFGCCEDQVTIKLDENGLGCNVSNVDLNCEANPNQEGCRTGIIPADCDNNPDQERCRAASAELDCAKNPKQDGCRSSAPNPDSCELSKFKCCFDNRTPARGFLENGKLDCPCEATEFGCCLDGKSVAQGSRFKGCDCRSSPHGCCSNGSVALGPRFIGCPDGPSLDLQYSAPACSLPKERGSCRNFTVAWFFDRQYGGCSRFWYGGCDGNGNRFQSQDECEGICMKPTGSEACALPLVKGSCNQEKLYWGYNSQKHVCEQFKYGGCLGNNNRFETRESCESTCYYSEYNDPCEQPLLPGQCAPDQTPAPQPRYYFNKFLNRCEAFIYSSCNGNKNNFVTIEECQNRCGARTAREICVLPVSPGTCLGKFPRYYFDYKSSACREFTYSGCGSNNNRFVDRESCERLCNSTIAYNPAYGNEISAGLPQPAFTIPVNEQDKKSSDISATLATLQYICNNNKDPGNCDGSFIKWFFNPVERKCQQFVYSGCSNGNPNRFDTRQDCEARCVHQLSAYIRLQQEQLLRQQYKIIEEQNQQRKHQLEKQVTQKQNVCLQPRETGNCYKFEPRFYYDPDDKGCHKFYYSGCNGNENNFATFEECTQRCGTPLVTSTSDLSRNRVTSNEQQSPHAFRTEDCFLPKERGPCDNDEPKWYYDSADGVCKQFYYSSCGGNNNRFNDGRECQKRCWNSQEICLLPKVRGPCNGNFSQWYYDNTVKDCLEFSYSGCQSNANRFSSKEMCLEACSSQSQGSYPSSILMEHMQNKKASDICHLKPEKGEGHEYLERYYFDPVQSMCKMFIYSGEGGNSNNFERRDQCERQCADGHKLEHPEPTDLAKRQEICLMPSDKGLCSQKFARWFYDPSAFTCSSMIYSGCGGNLNKFLTFDNCMNFCAGVKPKIEEDQSNNLLPTTTQQPTPAPFSPIYLQPTPPPMPTLEERPVPPEDCPVENCNQRCAFGVDTYSDSRGCTRCRCAHPCHVHSCPPGQRCAVEVYRTETGQALVQPICRLIRKPGECPPPVALSQLKQSCNSTCRIDADCRGADKCCNNGCANVCVAVQTNREENSDESEKLSLKVRLNDQAVLNCGLIPAQTEVSVAWNKDGRPVLQSVAAQQNRIQLLTNGSLLVIMTRPEDQGEYTCSYAKRETSELVTKKRIIEVYDPVSILPGPRQVIATLNQPAILSCNARGIPAPLVTWWKDKRILPTQSSKYLQNSENYQLRINSVTNEDAGLYYCQAHNDHGQIRVYDVTLLLEFEPNLRVPKIPELNDNSIYQPSRQQPIQQQSILGGGGGGPAQSTDSLSQVYVRQGQIVQGPNRQFSLDGRPIQTALEPLSVKTRLANEEYKTGSSLRIECLTNHNSNITWYFNNEPIESSNQLNSLARRDPKYAVLRNADNSISIETLIRQHSGVYKCKGSTEFSYAASDLTIEVEDIPLPAKCRDSNAYLNCQVIVNFRYCSNRTYFTYCCKSCVLSKQISIEEVYRRLT